MTRLQQGRRRSVANIRREAGTCAPEDLFEALLAHRANSATAWERGRCVCVHVEGASLRQRALPCRQGQRPARVLRGIHFNVDLPCRSRVGDR